jgi:hypothetical protein
MVEFLTNIYKARIDEKTLESKTLFHVTFEKGDIKVVELLTEKNKQNKDHKLIINLSTNEKNVYFILLLKIIN